MNIILLFFRMEKEDSRSLFTFGCITLLHTIKVYLKSVSTNCKQISNPYRYFSALESEFCDDNSEVVKSINNAQKLLVTKFGADKLRDLSKT